MATIKVTENQFPDIVVMFMMDYIMNDKITIDNDKWKYFIDKLVGKGLKPQLLEYYITIDAIEKSKYKEIQGIFSGKGGRSTINITKDINKPKENKVKKITKIIKKVLHLTEKRRNKYRGFPLHNDVIDDIIQKVINESIENGEIDNFLTEEQ